MQAAHNPYEPPATQPTSALVAPRIRSLRRARNWMLVAAAAIHLPAVFVGGWLFVSILVGIVLIAVASLLEARAAFLASSNDTSPPWVQSFVLGVATFLGGFVTTSASAFGAGVTIHDLQRRVGALLRATDRDRAA